MTVPPALGPADVWYAYPDCVSEAQLTELRRTLSHEEGQRARSFHFERDRTSFIVTRALLRLTLSRYVERAPAAWVFASNAHGKPALDPGTESPGLHFNVSHSPGLCACIVAGDEVGIDVENLTRPAPLGAVDRYFTRWEREDLWSRPEPERSARFFQYWTLKEAYLKARGLGFALPLGQIGVAIEGEQAELRLAAGCADDASRWLLKTWRATPDHQASVAVRRSLLDLRIAARWGLPGVAEPTFVHKPWADR